MSYPYSYFGFSLWRLRESRKKTSVEMSEYLKKYINPSEYRKYETGEILPNEQILLEISRVLKKDLSTLKQWAAYGGRKKSEGKCSQGALAYDSEFENAIAVLKEKYHEVSGHPINKAQNEALTKMKRYIFRIIDLPVLPMNFILIVDAITSKDNLKKYAYLHEIQNFISEGESLAGFISRDLYLAPIIFYLSNLLCFADKPCASIEQCMRQLNIVQFKELLLLAVYQGGIYDTEGDIPRLQQHADFNSMTCLFARELEKELKNDPPKNINFNHLYQACVLQGIGRYALFERLKPALIGTGEDLFDDGTNEDIYPGMGQKLFSQIVWELHPVVCAIIASNWNFPKEVSDLLLVHHDHPVSEVSPTCALLRIINFFVDADFPTLSKDDFQDMLIAYPQIRISVEAFYEVCCNLSKLKHQLYERSSSLLEHASQEVVDFTSRRIKQLALKGNVERFPSDGYLQMPLKRSDFRFDPKYQAILKNIAHDRLENLRIELFSPIKGEPLKNFEERMGNFQLRLKYALCKDLRDVAEMSQVSVDEIKLRLGLK